MNRHKKMTPKEKLFVKFYNGDISQTVKNMNNANITMDRSSGYKYLNHSYPVRQALKRKYKDNPVIMEILNKKETPAQNKPQAKTKKVSQPTTTAKTKDMTKEEILLILTNIARNKKAKDEIRIQSMELYGRFQGWITKKIEYSTAKEKPLLFSIPELDRLTDFLKSRFLIKLFLKVFKPKK